MRTHYMKRIIEKPLIAKKADKTTVGVHYIKQSFLPRHPTLTTKFSSQVKRQKVMNSDPALLSRLLHKLGEALQLRNIKPENLYNMDEKAIIQGKSARVKVICTRGRKSPPHITDGNKELITIIETVNAAGRYLSLMVVFVGVAQYRQWHEYHTPQDAETVFCHSKTGWSNQRLCLEYLVKLFDKHTTPSNPEEWRMLIVDGYTSHLTLHFVEYCDTHRVELFCIPAHTTHILQPLDVGLFGPLQNYYGRGVEDSLRTINMVINKTNFLPILYNARERAYTTANIQSAFLTTGVHPFNPAAVLNRFTGSASADD